MNMKWSWAIFHLLLQITVSMDVKDIEVYVKYLKQFEKPLERQYDVKRIDKFIRNLKIVSESNIRNDKPYKLKITKFADMLEEEVKELFSSELQPMKMETDTTTTTTAGDQVRNRQGSLRLASFPMAMDHLNWASEDNPFHVPLLTQVHDQGNKCGACWAFVAASSVEAAVKYSFHNNRNVQVLNTSSDTSDTASEAVYGTRYVPPVPSLSVQELLDCDRFSADGCQGGNPFQALAFIALHGLQEATSYPYQQTMHNTCLALLHTPRYFISQYRRLVPGNEQALLQALQSGPVATGICGTDPAFLFYSQGVFFDEACCTIQNHAVLIVGYGHDVEVQLDYWLVQNSWGVRWGDRGYMKLYRSSSSSAYSSSSVAGGMCGLALNPSQGSLGYMKNARGEIVTGRDLNPWLLLWYDSSVWWQSHWQLLAVLLASLLMCLSCGVLAYGLYLDQWLSSHHWHQFALPPERSQAGYQPIVDDNDNDNDHYDDYEEVEVVNSSRKSSFL